MADIRHISGASVPTRPAPAARTEAIRAAQRAFFSQALVGTSASAPARQVEQPVTPVAASTRLSFDASAPAPSVGLRPGSLLDIKV